MGIREYFKQHPEGEELKIQNLNLQDREKRGEEFEFEIDKWFFDEVFKYYKDTIKLFYDSDKRGLNFVNYAVFFKFLFPDRVNELVLKNEDWQFIKEKIKEHYIFGYFLNAREDVTDENRENWQSLKEDLERRRQEKSWGVFVIKLANARIWYPDKFEEIKIGKEEWKEIVKWHQDHIFNKYIDYYEYIIRLATTIINLKIIMAETIDFTKDGIKLEGTRLVETKGNQYKKKESKRPERKSF